MSTPVLLVLSVLAYTGLPVAYSLWRSPVRFLLLYVHLAAVLTIGGLLGATYVFPLGDVQVLAGQVAYGGFVFTAVLAFVVSREAQVLRNAVLLALAVDAVVVVLFRLSVAALTGDAADNPLGVPAAVFSQSLRSVVAGGVLIVAELTVVMVVLEAAKRRLGPRAMVPAYVGALVAPLLVDGLLFPVAVLWSGGPLAPLVVAGVQAKALLAAMYVVPLLVFLALNRAAVTEFEATPVSLRRALDLDRDDVLDRALRSERRATRVTATVDRILDAASTTILVTTDPQLRMTKVNRGAELLLGYAEADLLGRPLATLEGRDPEQPSPGSAALPWYSLADGRHRDVLLRSRQGRDVVVALSISEIRDDDTLVGYVAAGEDVTQRAEELAREQESVQRLREADRVKSELVWTASHELRTPIASIQGYTELLVDGSYGPLDAAQLAALAKVEHNTARLRALVDDLLFVADNRTTSDRFRRAPVDLCRVASVAWTTVEQLAADRELDLRLELPGHDVVVPGDELALERLLLNLAGNAVKFTPDGGAVLARVEVREDRAVLEVSDTGIGVPPDDLDKLFDQFFRSARANDDQIPGTGLGLSVARVIIEAHGATVDVASRPDQGTCFTVAFPVADPGATVDVAAR